jgi:hypothetical protein
VSLLWYLSPVHEKTRIISMTTDRSGKVFCGWADVAGHGGVMPFIVIADKPEVKDWGYQLPAPRHQTDAAFAKDIVWLRGEIVAQCKANGVVMPAAPKK